MASRQRRLSNSLELRLSLWLALLVVCTAIAAGLYAFVSAFIEANELQDDILRQVAALVSQQPATSLNLGKTFAVSDTDPESNVIVQPLSPGSGMHPDAGLLPLNTRLPDGLQTVVLNQVSYRTLVKTLHDGQRIAVLQETEVRDEIARDSAMQTALPLLLSMPVLLLVVTGLVRRMLRPVAQLAVDVDNRSEQELHPLTEAGLPMEIRPFVTAINRLLGRVSQSVQAQQRFVADAAHELRSPLTALSLQAERLAASKLPAPAQERMLQLRRGIQRLRGLLEQLLTLARAEASPVRPMEPVSVLQAYRIALEDLLPLAEAKQQDIGVVSVGDAIVLANEIDLQLILKNLISNAIQYTPAGGRIDLSVSLEAGHARLRICDSGPGIPPQERQKVLAPFYRTPGSSEIGYGLGLPIVTAMARRIGAELMLDYSDETTQRGLCVTLRLPVAC